MRRDTGSDLAVYNTEKCARVSFMLNLTFLCFAQQLEVIHYAACPLESCSRNHHSMLCTEFEEMEYLRNGVKPSNNFVVELMDSDE